MSITHIKWVEVISSGVDHMAFEVGAGVGK